MSKIIDDDHINMLLDKIKLKEFENGAVFEMNTDNLEEALESAMRKEKQSYKRDNLSENIGKMPITLLDDEDDSGTPGSTEFATIALKMVNIGEDGKIKKRVLRAGTGSITPSTALVEVHYNAYYEFSDDAFDSTYLRGQTHKFVPLTGDCIAGLGQAVTTMQKGEVAQFLIHYDLAYGKLGIPPRIPPAAELLFEIQLINFIDGVQTKSVEELNGEEVIDIDKAIAAKHLEGNELFAKKETIREAIAKYNKALSMIDECIQFNKADFDKYKPRMVTLCANLALCHLKRNNYVQAVKICERALSVQPNHCKSLFYYGRALLQLAEYDDAKVKLTKAQKLEPTNKAINGELLKLEMLRRQYEASSKEISERMFMNQKPGNIMERSQSSKWYIYLSDFKDKEGSTTFVLPASIPATEVAEIETEAKSLGLLVSKENDSIVIKKQ